MTEQRNLLIASVLSMIVVFGWQYLVGGPQLQQEQARQAELQKQQQTKQTAAGPQAAPGAGAPATQATLNLPRAAALAQSPQRAPIDTPTLDGSINHIVGRFDVLRLRTYHETPDPKSPEIELLSPLA